MLNNDSIKTHTSTIHFGSWFLAVLTVSAIWMFSISTVNLRRSMHKIYDDFGAELPGFTKLALRIPDSAIFAGAALLSVILLVKEFRMQNRLHALIINITVLASCVVLFEIYREVLSHPLLKLLEELS